MASASKMIMGEVPLLNKEAKATVRDSIAISPDLLGKFMALVKSAISESITVASAPLSHIRGISFDTEKDMYDSYMRTTLASSGINTNLIFTSNVKPNAIETQLSLNVDEQMMTALYEQFEDFINYWLRKMTKHFKFRIKFEGTDFFLDRDSRFDKAMALFNQGIVLPPRRHRVGAGTRCTGDRGGPSSAPSVIADESLSLLTRRWRTGIRYNGCKPRPRLSRLRPSSRRDD